MKLTVDDTYILNTLSYIHLLPLDEIKEQRSKIFH